MAAIRIILVEDDWIIAKEIALNLQTLGFDVPAIFESGEDFLAQVETLPYPDLVILDMELAGNMSGLEVAHQLRTYPIPFLFLTAKADHPTIQEAATAGAYNYLIKPIRSEHLFSAVEVALHWSKQNKALPSPNERVLNFDDLLFVKARKRLERIQVRDILWIQAEDIYVVIHTQTEHYVLSQPLKVMEEKLPPQYFIRIHRSYVVQIQAIDSIEENELKIGSQVLPIGKTFREKLMRRLTIL